MNDFSLEVDHFGEWASEGRFCTLAQAFEFGKDFFSTSIWRVIDMYSGATVYSNDPVYQSNLQGNNEIERFQSAERSQRLQQRSYLQRQIRRRMSNTSLYSGISLRHFQYGNFWKSVVNDLNIEKPNWQKDGF